MNGFIYKITSTQTNNVYIGSTYTPILERLNQHKMNKATSSKELTKYDDCKIELVKEYPNIGMKELRRHEGLAIRQTANTVNKNMAGLGLSKTEYQRRYRNKHRQVLYARQNTKFKCDCGGKYTRQNKLAHLTTKLHTSK